MCCINEEHHTTSHHPHVTVDKQFVSMHPHRLVNTYRMEHEVITKNGVKEKWTLHGLKATRCHSVMEVGMKMKTIEGSREIKTLRCYSLSPETQLYNLVIGGSHTYHVDGYAVTGWPREDDFDYDEWKPITQ